MRRLFSPCILVVLVLGAEAGCKKSSSGKFNEVLAIDFSYNQELYRIHQKYHRMYAVMPNSNNIKTQYPLKYYNSSFSEKTLQEFQLTLEKHNELSTLASKSMKEQEIINSIRLSYEDIIRQADKKIAACKEFAVYLAAVKDNGMPITEDIRFDAFCLPLNMGITEDIRQATINALSNINKYQ